MQMQLSGESQWAALPPKVAAQPAAITAGWSGGFVLICLAFAECLEKLEGVTVITRLHWALSPFVSL